METVGRADRYSLLQVLLLVTILLLTIFSGSTLSSVSPTCSSGKINLPSAEDWREFNRTTGGRLISPRPTAYYCYGQHFNAATCQNVRTNYTNAFFRSTNAGSTQTWNWEETKSQRCSLETVSQSDTKCEQGLVPHYGVDVSSIDDIKKSIQFAAKHQLRLFVKSTGHDYAGRSNSPNSLMLWMHHFGNIVTSFLPHNSSVEDQAAVTVSGGKTWRDVYAKVSHHLYDQYVVVGPLCPSVGAAGGYPLGGGHGPLSPSFGLAVDNILQIEVVTPEGKLRVVNECQDPELFWALRGGGGGTFGVVTAVTYKLHKEPRYYTSVDVQILNGTNGTNIELEKVHQLLTIFARHAEKMDEGKWAGWLQVSPSVGFTGLFLVPQKLSVVNATLTDFLDAWKTMAENSDLLMTSEIRSHYTFRQWYKSLREPTLKIFEMGLRGVLGGRLIPRSSLNDPDKLGRTLTGAISMSDAFIGAMVAGPGVRGNDQDSNTTSVTPTWRTTFMDSIFLQTWSHDTSEEGIRARKDALNRTQAVLDQAYPEAGAYFGVSYREDNWQDKFWGKDNYERLLKVKNRVDPYGLFSCVQCVGSDGKDRDEINCDE